jgi:hypothetical protein
MGSWFPWSIGLKGLLRLLELAIRAVGAGLAGYLVKRFFE